MKRTLIALLALLALSVPAPAAAETSAETVAAWLDTWASAATPCTSVSVYLYTPIDETSPGTAITPGCLVFTDPEDLGDHSGNGPGDDGRGTESFTCVVRADQRWACVDRWDD